MNGQVPYTQSGRMIAISTPLGEDVLLLEHLAVDEGINGLFSIHASVKSQRDDLKASDLIGSTVDFSLKLKDAGTRWWNGFVTELHEGPLTSRGTRSYALTIRPKLWVLSQTSNCRKFQNLASPSIVEQLCKEHGITDLDLRITGAPAAQEYSVQWNETDLDYLVRRLQFDGIFYWFEHQQGKHTLVVADHVSGYRDSSEPQVRYTLGSAAQDHITEWRRTFAFTSGKRAGRDWNFLTMNAPEGDQTSFDIVPGSAATELYEFPGLFSDSTSAEQAMKYRIQTTETGYETVAAASSVRTLGPGQRFTPQDTANPNDVFAQQVMISIRHVAHDQTYESAATSRPSYENTFAAMPATTPATPHRTVPRPRIVGSQIALIAGPSGEEIFTEQYGRVKVFFPWDRLAQKDGSDTPWIRVGQPWGGTTWGHQVIPRIGMEALVSYQEGDPDRPFITAIVPDPTNPVPYTLPDNKTRMVFRSKSYKSSGNNEMTFEDLTGAENQFFNASKDQTTNVVNNLTRSIGVDQSVSIGQNQSTTVGSNSTTEVGGSMNVTVGGTGAGAAAMMAPLMGLAGQTSGLLSQALGAAAGGGASVMSMIPQIASAALGVLGAAGQSAQSGVVSPSNPLSDAGTALATSGASLGSAVGSLFAMPGALNVSVASMRTDSVGIARTEQIGVSKVTNVGQTFNTQVGNAWGLTIGQSAATNIGQSEVVQVGQTSQETIGKMKTILAGQTINLGAGQSITLVAGDASKCSLSLDQSGTLVLEASNQIILRGGGGASLTVGPGPVLYTPSLVQGSAPPCAACLRAMAANSVSFVQA